LRKLTVAWPLVICLLLPALTRAEIAVQAWVQLYTGPGNGNDQASDLAVDGSGNVIVVGCPAGGRAGTIAAKGRARVRDVPSSASRDGRREPRRRQ
jgi:hypothetical protein